MSQPVSLQVMAASEDPSIFRRPCVDCGLITSIYCDYCFAMDRLPSEVWENGQYTPLCSSCDKRFDMCHDCRGIHWATPPPWKESDKSDGVTMR